MKFGVNLWSGAGYLLDNEVIVENDINNLEEILIKASILDDNCLYKEVNKLSKDEYNELENSDCWVYLDRTCEGHSCIFLCIENLFVNNL